MVTAVRRLLFVLILLGIINVQRVEGDVRVYKLPMVNRICGVVVDQDGRPIPGVNVSVLKNGTVSKTAKTNDAGEFDFDANESGKYELDAEIAGFQHARYQLTLSEPTDSCKHALEIEMAVGGIHPGGDIRLTNRRLSVPDAKTAIAIAKLAAIKAYGKEQIAHEEPLTATLENGVWSVYGSLCCPDRKGSRTCEVGKCVGGVVKVQIRQSDGKVTSVSHTK